MTLYTCSARSHKGYCEPWNTVHFSVSQWLPPRSYTHPNGLSGRCWTTFWKSYGADQKLWGRV